MFGVLIAVVVAAVLALVAWLVFGRGGGPATGTAEPDTTSAPSTEITATTTTATRPPAHTTVRTAALPPLLLGLEEIKEITGNTGLVDAGVTTRVEAPPATVATFDPPECMSSFGAHLPPAYENSGYVSVYAKNHMQQPTPSMQVAEGVTDFADPAAAQRALTGYVDLWRGCAGKRFQWTHVAQGEFSMWTLGAPEDAGDGVTTLRSNNDASPVSVTRAVAAKNNVLVDVWIIGSAVSGEAATIAKRIVARIPA
ncbi:hypothetical protein A5727_25965 [Mycobacterium sp. ACS4331]|nr:hypothetical protein A5727_25965 [Mycobacterium sp. ACS4331]